MNVTVRLANQNDTNDIQHVGHEAFAAVRAIYRPKPSTITNSVTDLAKFENLIAELDGQIIASVRFGEIDDRLHLIGLGVLPEFQRRGIASQLIDELSCLAQNKYCRALSLYTITQTGNVPIFVRMGFTALSEKPDTHSISTTGELLFETYMEKVV